MARAVSAAAKVGWPEEPLRWRWAAWEEHGPAATAVHQALAVEDLLPPAVEVQPAAALPQAPVAEEEPVAASASEVLQEEVDLWDLVEQEVDCLEELVELVELRDPEEPRRPCPRGDLQCLRTHTTSWAWGWDIPM